ncbi:MAG: AAA family ATPase [Chloroflexi bacterium]|nr:AAA family ATPase [Chloroflexota bacterium]
MDRTAFEVPPERLRWRCDPERFPFVCTDELNPLDEFIGQERALRALEFGLAMDRPGYNIFVTGLSGTGRASAIQAYLQRRIAEKGVQGSGPHPQDRCYLHNFADPDRPQLVALPGGRGRSLRHQIERLLTDLRQAIARALTEPEFEAHRKALLDAAQAESQAVAQALEQEALGQGFLLRPAPMGIQIIPQVNGRPLSREEYMAISGDLRAALEAQERELRARVEAAFERGHQLQREANERVQALVEQTGDFASSHLFQELTGEYRDFPPVLQFLQDLRTYTLEHLDLFLENGRAGPQPQEPPSPPGPTNGLRRLGPDNPYLPFRVNVLVDNSGRTGPPVVIEPHPTYGNLFGKVERRSLMGAYFSDHTMIKPGALHLANGGYLILNARDVLATPAVWESLKRALRVREVRLEDPMEQMVPGFAAPQGLRPEPMPLTVKVIMTGPPLLYQLLSRTDEEFWEAFKVRADFDTQIPRTDTHLDAYARFVGSCCGRHGLLHFHRTAVAEVAEYGARAVADQEKLSSRFGPLEDLLIEADYWARRAEHTMVMGEDVRKALHEKVYRASLVEERIRELITQGTILVDVEGEQIGQVNGLAVYDLGDISFGRPSRVTAQTFMGRNGVINIERESQLSGKIHDKGVLILSGYLGARYAQDKPLSLAASICFEQSYEEVEGDSASSTELYAILSDLAGAPIQQEIAVTGSVNQKGEIQPIGGANEKIEGFFAVCKAKGLTGNQGVLIPAQNVRNLMLRHDVVEAVQQGLFHVYAVSTVDEAISLLTGWPAGARESNGAYPEGTINALVDRRLRELAQGIQAFSGRESTGNALPPGTS